MNSYNPLEKRNLAENVVNELLRPPATPLKALATFQGAGVYVIYYTGPFEQYASVQNDVTGGTFDKPIYVGKAIPAGGRMGGFGLDSNPGAVLFSRLREHLESVRQAENLNTEDFYYRSLVVDDIWIPLSEALLITSFQPVWNVTLTGFGNHDPGGGRYQQRRSQWDTVHPGRSWALKCQPNSQSLEEILAAVEAKQKTSEPEL